MSVSEYKKWLKDKRRFDASLPGFFPLGAKRTVNVLEGDSTEASKAKWQSFKARHGKQYCKKPTYKRAIALRNWGIAVKIPKKGW
jgi:hypothetical protein